MREMNTREGIDMENSVIETKNVTKKYIMGNQTVSALDGVSMAIKPDSFVSITGTSGSGKSTLLNLLGGIDTPTSGEVYVAGKNIHAMKERELAILRRDSIGFVFQRFCLVPELNVEENIVFPALLKGKNVDMEYMHFLCERLGLMDRIMHMPSELSGGQQQRVAIARALINKPQVLLCDEPTGNLDKKTSNDVVRLLVELRKELSTTLVVVTHDQTIAELADEKFFLEDGKIVKHIE